MDTAQWAQGNGIVPPVENSIRPTEKKPRPEKEKALNCPRCNSTNTKFCYYNNYSLSQPRYFCKSCRRYWTQGGTFRNVPVGGGSRKARRSYSSNSSSSSISSKKVIPDLISTPPKLSTQTQSPNYQGQDLNLAYDHPPKIFNGVSGAPFVLDMENPNYPSAVSNSQFLSFPMLDFKSSFDFSLDNSICASMMQPASSVQEHHIGLTSGGGFPLEELKGASSSELGETTNSNGDWSQCWLGIPGEHM